MKRSPTGRIILLAAASAAVAIPSLAEPPTARPPLIEHVPANLLETNPTVTATTTRPDLPSARLDARGLVAPRDRTSTGRWRRFEAEFGIHHREPTVVKGSLQLAKYQLDEKIFAVKEFIDHEINFDLSVRDLLGGTDSSRRGGANRVDTGNQVRRAPENPLLGWLEDARLKSDIGLSSQHKGFIGIRLVLPISD